MGIWRDLFGGPPAQPEASAPKKEKPADPQKEAMRELAGEIKELEASIGQYEDVDLNSSEAPIKDFKPEVEGNAKRQARGELKKVSREIKEKEYRSELVSKINKLEAEIDAYEEAEELDFTGTEGSQRSKNETGKEVKRGLAEIKNALALGRKKQIEKNKLKKFIKEAEEAQRKRAGIEQSEQQIKAFEPEAEVNTKRRARGELKKNASAQRKQPLPENVIAQKDLATKEGWRKRAEIKRVLKEIEAQEKALSKLSEDK